MWIISAETMETVKRNQMKTREMKNTVTEMKKAVNGFISRLNTAKKGINAEKSI